MSDGAESVIILGGGAAGFFAALSAAQHRPDAAITIIEIGSQVLSKVKISGGGRCNVCNAEKDIDILASKYPRGSRLLKRLFYEFGTADTINWFESRGVKLKTEAHGHMFPVTDNSQTVISCLMREAKKYGIKILTKHRMTKCERLNSGFKLSFKKHSGITCDKLIVATGGNPKAASYNWLANLGHKIEPPVPSLFTFNMPGENIRKLMGVATPHVSARIQGIKLKSEGPLLITHWGMSGPAILKLSAWGARELSDIGYEFTLQLSWTAETNDSSMRELLQTARSEFGRKQIKNAQPFDLTSRLWEYLIARTDIPSEKPWAELGKKDLNRLAHILSSDSYPVSGKTTFKEEFVTCGGISHKSINPKTLESKFVPGLYFAGEVLDIDGITGGYNFQSAWTTGFIAGKLA